MIWINRKLVTEYEQNMRQVTGSAPILNPSICLEVYFFPVNLVLRVTLRSSGNVNMIG